MRNLLALFALLSLLVTGAGVPQLAHALERAASPIVQHSAGHAQVQIGHGVPSASAVVSIAADDHDGSYPCSGDAPGLHGSCGVSCATLPSGIVLAVPSLRVALGCRASDAKPRSLNFSPKRPPRAV